MNEVLVIKASPESLRAQVSIAASPALKRFDKAKPVYFKINGNCDKYYPGSNTSPWFLDAVLCAFQDAGFRDIVIIEGDLFEFKVEKMLRETYLENVIGNKKAKYLNYENEERDEDACPRFLNDAQIVNLPVMHTHGFAKISVAVKNLWGFLPVTRRKLHRQMYEILMKLYAKYRMFNLVDGTVGMVGDSTRTGLPKRLDLVLSGWDALSVDSACASIMGFRREEIPHLNLAASKGLIKDFTINGDFTERNLPKHNFNYSDSSMRKLTRWLEAMESPNAINTITSEILKLGPIDFAYQSARTGYNNMVFKSKQEKIYSGDWKDYERCVQYIKFKH
ncbi:MAG: DUF362 domain-containing protein [Candidatus Micrarchaeota archaeon]